MLTEVAIRAAKPRDKPWKMFDERGLFLLITPTGGKLWRLKFFIAGREKLISLGKYPEVALKLARDRRDDARRAVAEGRDPSAERKATKATQENTFKALAEEWLDTQKHLSAGTIRRDRHRLEDFIVPTLGAIPVNEITAPALLSALRKIEARGTHETAHRTRAAVGRVLRFAIATGRAQRDVTADLKGALTPVSTQNFPAITDPRRVGELLRAIDGYSGCQPEVLAALKLAPLVFVRPGELRGARWAELELDSNEPMWRIPGERMKMGEQHVVPLSKQAVEILKELHPLTGAGDLVFPGLRSKSRPISDNTLNAALRRLGFSKDEQTTHGFRSIASTLLNEQGWHPDLIELQLAHAERNEVRAAYNKAQRLTERRQMMQAWADYLDGLKAGGKVIGIKAKKR